MPVDTTDTPKRNKGKGKAKVQKMPKPPLSDVEDVRKQVHFIAQEQIDIIKMFYQIEHDAIVDAKYPDLSTSDYEQDLLLEAIEAIKNLGQKLNDLEPDIFDLDVNIDKIEQQIHPSNQDQNKLHVIRTQFERLLTVLDMQYNHFRQEKIERQRKAWAMEASSSHRDTHTTTETQLQRNDQAKSTKDKSDENRSSKNSLSESEKQKILSIISAFEKDYLNIAGQKDLTKKPYVEHLLAQAKKIQSYDKNFVESYLVSLGSKEAGFPEWDTYRIMQSYLNLEAQTPTERNKARANKAFKKDYPNRWKEWFVGTQPKSNRKVRFALNEEQAKRVDQIEKDVESGKRKLNQEPPRIQPESPDVPEHSVETNLSTLAVAENTNPKYLRDFFDEPDNVDAVNQHMGAYQYKEKTYNHQNDTLTLHFKNIKTNDTERVIVTSENEIATYKVRKNLEEEKLGQLLESTLVISIMASKTNINSISLNQAARDYVEKYPELYIKLAAAVGQEKAEQTFIDGKSLKELAKPKESPQHKIR